MYCQKCGKELLVGAAYCPRCGAPVNGRACDAPAAGMPASGCAAEEAMPPAEGKKRYNGFAVACFVLALLSLFPFVGLGLYALGIEAVAAADASGWLVFFTFILGGMGFLFSILFAFAFAGLSAVLGIVALIQWKDRRASWLAVAGIAIVVAAAVTMCVLQAL